MQDLFAYQNIQIDSKIIFFMYMHIEIYKFIVIKFVEERNYTNYNYNIQI